MFQLLRLQKKELFSGIIFAIILLTIASLYNYHELVFYRPQSTHKWRQSDCNSITMNYYQGGMKFFKPEVHNLTSEKGETGKAFTSELPFFYYSVAILYKIFGPNEAIYRLLNTLLFLLGLFFLHKIILLISNDLIWSVIIPLLFFTSPVLVYYGNNFLTNTPALAFSIIGWYYFIKFIYNRNPLWLYTSIIVLFFAATFKVTAFFSFFAIGGIIFLEAIGIKMSIKNTKLFKKPWQALSIMLIAFATIVSWILVARIQNTQN